MTHVTKDSLPARIAELEAGPRSLKEDFQLEAYRMLLAKMLMCSNCNHETTAEDIEYGQCGFCGNDL